MEAFPKYDIEAIDALPLTEFMVLSRQANRIRWRRTTDLAFAMRIAQASDENYQKAMRELHG